MKYGEWVKIARVAMFFIMYKYCDQLEHCPPECRLGEGQNVKC